MSKQEDIVKHILSLKVGTKISVRGIASEMKVSEGTSYSAIKQCNSIGVVATIPRVGTVRIEKVEKKSIQSLTYMELINIIDGHLVSGREGVHRTLNRFVIGAMTLDAMEKYISPGCLLIVGNREEAQKLALNKQAAVLITGGFPCSEEIKALADEKQLPIISSSYDTFTIATMINKAMSENLIKKEIILVEDIMKLDPKYIKVNNTIAQLRKLIEKTSYSRYPVVDEDMKVRGIITTKHIPIEVREDEIIERIMTKKPLCVTSKTTAAYAAHIMGWEGIELCPVIDGKKLIGVISRQDVIKAMQSIARQPQVGETLEDMILKNFEFQMINNKLHFKGKIIPEMLDSFGTASWSSLNMLISTMGILSLKQKNNMNITVDSIVVYFMKPVQMDSIIEVDTNILDLGRNFCKVEINMTNDKAEIIGKGMLSAKILKR